MKAIDVIVQTLRRLGYGQEERVYQSAIRDALRAAGFQPTRPKLPDLGHLDFFIPGTPPLLVELKASIDWKAIACGLAQLRIYGSHGDMKQARKILALPEAPMHPGIFRKMAADLGIDIVTP